MRLYFFKFNYRTFYLIFLSNREFGFMHIVARMFPAPTIDNIASA